MATTTWNPNGQVGIAANAWQPGVLIQTGTAGPSNTNDYTNGGTSPLPIYDAQGNLLPPGMSIPGGTYISIGQPPQGTTGGGNQAVTGSSIVAQQQQWLYEQGQLANQAQEVANNYAIGVAQVQATAAQTAEQLKAAEANYAVSVAQIQSSYQNDVAQFGLQKAQDLAQAKLAQAQFALQTAQAQQQNAQLQLNVAQANASQRQAQATAYQNAVQTMANRTGPQDEVAYQRLVAGMNAPTPTSSTTIDPFAYIKDMYQPISIPNVPIPQAPSDLGASAISSAQGPAPMTIPSFDFGSVPQPNISTTPPNIPTATATATGGPSPTSATGGTTPGNTTGGAPTTSQGGVNPGGPNMDVGIYGQNALPGESGTAAYGGTGIPNTAVQWLQPGQTVNLETGTGGPFSTSSLGAGYGVGYNGGTYNNQSTPMQIPGGQYVSVYRMNSGGALRGGPMALVGDGPGKAPDRNAELAQALVDQATGQPVLKVTPPDQTRSILNTNGLPSPAIAGLTVPRADTGGTYGNTPNGTGANPYAGTPGEVTNPAPGYGGNGANGSYGTALNNPTMTFNQYSPSVLGSQPFYQQLTGQSQSRPFGAFGANVSNPQLGIYNAPTGINLRTYNYLLPSQQAGFQSLYGQGLSINPDDIVKEAQNAAPTGMYYGYVPLVANHYGG